MFESEAKIKDSIPIPNELSFAINKIYKPAGIEISDIVQEREGLEYRACRFTLNDRAGVFRVAKTTPSKIGQFVTLWQRSSIEGIIKPLDSKDRVSWVIIHSSDNEHVGQFILNSSILKKKGIISHNGKNGKLGFRVYPPWSNPIAKQAINTQKWQLEYFLDFSLNTKSIVERIKLLLNNYE